MFWPSCDFWPKVDAHWFELAVKDDTQMCGAPRMRKFVFISESRHVEVNTDSVWNDGELWRIIGIPSDVPTGTRFKVILEEVPSSTPFDTPVEDDNEKELKELKHKIEKLKKLVESLEL